RATTRHVGVSRGASATQLTCDPPSPCTHTTSGPPAGPPWSTQWTCPSRSAQSDMTAASDDRPDVSIRECADQSSTTPSMQVTASPPARSTPVRVTSPLRCTRPARPGAVPCRATYGGLGPAQARPGGRCGGGGGEEPGGHLLQRRAPAPRRQRCGGQVLDPGPGAQGQ